MQNLKKNKQKIVIFSESYQKTKLYHQRYLIVKATIHRIDVSNKWIVESKWWVEIHTVSYGTKKNKSKMLNFSDIWKKLRYTVAHVVVGVLCCVVEVDCCVVLIPVLVLFVVLYPLVLLLLCLLVACCLRCWLLLSFSPIESGYLIKYSTSKWVDNVPESIMKKYYSHSSNLLNR